MLHNSHRFFNWLKVLLLLPLFTIKAQTITPSVINSAGMHRVGAGGVSLTDNVGEPFTTTIGNSNFLITQGFLQPASSINSAFTASLLLGSDLKCKGKEEDAYVFVEITKPLTVVSYSAQYLWSKPGTCRTCSRIDTLSPGNYSVLIVLNYTTNTGAQKNDTLRAGPQPVKDGNAECRIKIYTGVSPNGDGINDQWVIDNITEYPKNKVSIYNRWGTEVYGVSGYNNTTKSFPTPDILNKLPASTYFYIIELGDGTAPIKGWLELIKTN
jgi:gliding motility-associated-like protein